MNHAQARSSSLLIFIATVALLAPACGGAQTYGPPAEAPGGYGGYRAAPTTAEPETDSVASAEGWDFWSSDKSEDGDYYQDESRSADTAGLDESSEPAPSAADAPPSTADQGSSQGGAGGEEPRPSASRAKRIIIYTAAMTILVLEVEVALKKAETFSEEIGGWIQASTSNSVTLRVPAEHFRQVLAWAREMGTVQAENVVGQDVTEEFLDLEIRMRNAMETRDRYAALLSQATKVEEILAIEAELGRITGEIESYKGRLRYLKEHSSYSTITLTFQPKPERYQGGRRVSLPFSWLRAYELRQLYPGGYY